MSALQLHVTPAGLAAIINAENTGTAPVLIAQIGLTDQVFTAEGATVLPGELKRLSTFAGAAVADDTIHVTIRDDSADIYTLRGFGLYLASGTLFAVYSHAGETPNYIMQKAAAAMLLLQSDVRFKQINATSIAFGDSDWLNPPGTETVPGVLELATDAETATGTDNSRAVHPKGLKALLDSRFGAGAPSAFVKGLLTLATAALMRTALGLKSAALKDEGAGNLLDADKLDGQEGSYYLAWANFSGKPATFPPSAHMHTWANLTDPPATATRWPSYAEVTDKPASFPPSAHTHAAADISSGTLAVARIPALPTSQITGLDTALAGKVDAVGVNAAADSTLTTFQNGAVTTGSLTAGGPMVGGIGTYITARSNSDNRVAQLVFTNAGGNMVPDAWIRVSHSTSGGGGWTGFFKLWHEGNFDPASKANAAHTHAMGDVTGLTTALDAKAALASPALTGTPTAPTVAGATNNTQLATTAFVHAHDDPAKANLASPALTGTPTAPTAAAGTNTTQIATTAFVAALGALKANLVSPALTGTPTAPTAAAATNTAQLATTAFVHAHDDPAKANLVSPALTGTPTAPTAAAATNTTQLATTAFVHAAIAAALANYLPKNNPVFTGTMTGPAYNKSP
jgi:hypothetical protein